MSQFTTRVELRDANYSDYISLHEAMKARGFNRYITGSDGTKYDLPDAEYDSQGGDAYETRTAASEAAASTGRKYRVLVSRSDLRVWVGLAEI